MLQHQDITDISSQLPCTHTNGTRDLNWIDKLIVHHSATDYDTGDIVQTLIAEANYQIHNQAINPGGSAPDGLQYHFVIFKGQIYRTRPDSDLLWHASDWPTNQHSLAACIQGNYDNITISDEDRQALDNLIWMLSFNASGDFTDLANINTYDGQSLYSHHEVADANMGTQCCGSNLIPIVTQARETKIQSEVDYWNSKNPPAPTPTPAPQPAPAPTFTQADIDAAFQKGVASMQSQIDSLTQQLKDAQATVTQDTSIIQQDENTISQDKVTEDNLVQQVQTLKNQITTLTTELQTKGQIVPPLQENESVIQRVVDFFESLMGKGVK